MIVQYPKVKKYFQDRRKLDIYQKQLTELESSYLLLKEETEKFEDNLEVKKAHPVIFWLIVIFSAQNILFYLYWAPLYEMIKGLL